MAVEQYVSAEHDQQRHQQPRAALQDGIVPGLKVAVVRLRRHAHAQRLRVVALGQVQEQQHRAGRDEQHVGLAQRVEAAEVQDDAGDDVHRAGVLQALLHIEAGNLVVHQRVRAAELGQIQRRVDQQRAQAHAHQHRHRAVDTAQQAFATGVAPAGDALVGHLLPGMGLGEGILPFGLLGRDQIGAHARIQRLSALVNPSAKVTCGHRAHPPAS